MEAITNDQIVHTIDGKAYVLFCLTVVSNTDVDNVFRCVKAAKGIIQTLDQQPGKGWSSGRAIIKALIPEYLALEFSNKIVQK